MSSAPLGLHCALQRGETDVAPANGINDSEKVPHTWYNVTIRADSCCILWYEFWCNCTDLTGERIAEAVRDFKSNDHRHQFTMNLFSVTDIAGKHGVHRS